MRGYRFARQPFMSPRAVGTGPIIALVIMAGIVLLLGALAGP
jgi:hypothetical protein